MAKWSIDKILHDISNCIETYPPVKLAGLDRNKSGDILSPLVSAANEAEELRESENLLSFILSSNVHRLAELLEDDPLWKVDHRKALASVYARALRAKVESNVNS